MRPTQWEYVKPLYEITDQVERQRTKKAPLPGEALNEKIISKFLQGEMSLDQEIRTKN